MLKAENITVTYRGRAGIVRALQGVSIEASAGELVAVVGPSGSGKTTLLMVLGGLLRPDAGSVAIKGSDVYTCSAGQRDMMRNRSVGFVFQQFHLIPYLTVLQNTLSPSVAAPSQEARRRAEELVRQFGLEARTGHLPGELSTGERQRTAMARALLNDPPLILADEPTGNLDEVNGRTVIDCLAGCARQGRAVVLVTHDERLAAHAARAVRLRDGGIVG